MLNIGMHARTRERPKGFEVLGKDQRQDGGGKDGSGRYDD